MKYLIIVLTLTLTSCTTVKNTKAIIRISTDACASGYVDRVRVADDNSSTDVTCKSDNIMRFMPFQP